MTFEEKIRFMDVLSKRSYDTLMQTCNEHGISPYIALNRIVSDWRVYKKAEGGSIVPTLPVIES